MKKFVFMKTQTTNLGKTAITIGGVHNKDKAYDKLTMVLNKYDGISYCSRKPVPMGVEISNIKYWMPYGITGRALILAMTTGDSEVKAMTQKAVTDLYNAFKEDVNKKFAEQAEMNNALQSISEEAQHYANLSQEASEKYLEAIEKLSPDQQAALQLAVTVGTHTREIADLETRIGGTSFVYITESQYQTLSLTGEVELVPAVLDDNDNVITPAIILKFDENATYMTYEDETPASY